MQSEEKQECPECAERIPVGVVACPLCGADLAWRLRPGEAAASLDAIRQGLDDYMGFGATGRRWRRALRCLLPRPSSGL